MQVLEHEHAIRAIPEYLSICCISAFFKRKVVEQHTMLQRLKSELENLTAVAANYKHEYEEKVKLHQRLGDSLNELNERTSRKQQAYVQQRW